MSFFSRIAAPVNSAFHLFNSIQHRGKAAEKLSVIDGSVKTEDPKDTGLPQTMLNYYGLFYEPIDSNKLNRLKIYRQMSTLPEISDAFDEVCDSFLNTDENGDFVHCKFAKVCAVKDDNDRIRVQKEFYKFISLFDFSKNTYSYLQTFLSDGELAFENIVNPEKMDLGVVGVRELENENYEFLQDSAKRNVGLFYRTATTKEFSVLSSMSPAVFGKISNPGFITATQSMDKTKLSEGVPLPFAQVTYINTGNFAPNKQFIYSILEKVRKVYLQLTLLEDAAIVYRVARSPERLVFNVATGKLPRQKADEELAKIALRFQSKKGASVGGNGQIYNKYDSINALESFFFAKPEGADGTNVTTLSRSASFGDMDDVKYFVKKLYLGLKVPYSRVESPEIEYKRGESISYEEYRFAKFLIRLQSVFAAGLMSSFKTHLILTGLWESLKLRDRDLSIEFCKPSNYDLYLEQQLVKIKGENYSQFSDKPEFSREYLMKKYLKMSETEIKENFDKVANEKITAARVDALAGKMAETMGVNLPLPAGDFGSPSISTPSATSFELPSEIETPETSAPETPNLPTPETTPTIPEIPKPETP
jgi:hypothetical protein